MVKGIKKVTYNKAVIPLSQSWLLGKYLHKWRKSVVLFGFKTQRSTIILKFRNGFFDLILSMKLIPLL